jgi:hypothetical protein
MTSLSLGHALRLGLNPGRRRRVPSFSPADLAGLAFWYDAASSPLLQAGGVVERWDDLSGSARHASQGTAAQRPLKTSDDEGRTVIRFDGSDDALLVASPPDLSAGVTMFVVFRMRTREDFRRILAAGAASGTDHAQFFAFQNDTAASRQLQIFSKSTQANPAIVKKPDSTEIQYAVLTVAAASTGVHDLNGVASDASTDLAMGTPAALVLGGGVSNGAPFSHAAVDLYEVGLYPRVLSAEEIEQLEAYLRGRRGLVWNPNHIGGDLRWYHDAGQGGFTLDAGMVSQWHDRSGAGRHWVQSGAARPSLAIDEAGRQAVRFDGEGDVMTLAGTPPALEPFSAAVVYRVRERHDFAGVHGAAAASGVDHGDFWAFRQASAASGEMQLLGRSQESDPLDLARPDDGSARIAIWAVGGGQASLRDQAGVVSDSYDGGFGTPAEIVLGGRYEGAPFGFAAIDVLATVGVARKLSEPDQQRLVDWAKRTWGI